MRRSVGWGGDGSPLRIFFREVLEKRSERGHVIPDGRSRIFVTPSDFGGLDSRPPHRHDAPPGRTVS
ncbi:MAG: hypothetical protein U9N48_00065 [Euryarchaeota archaeon]|nr:hypothetical protein [Euryarchaeota archaeon]